MLRLLCFNQRRAFEVEISPSSWTKLAWLDLFGLHCVVSVVFEMCRSESACSILNVSADLLRLSIQNFLQAVSPLKSLSWAHGGLFACVTAAHVYHLPPQALSTERDAGEGATLQIPPGCGITNKQPRGIAATHSLFTPSAPPGAPSTLFISSQNNLQFVSRSVPYT